ncbi:unnamed protein product [Phyllotreta striolata]|uniref:ADP-ribosylation factor-like protein 13B n=1 Tax=Phyllotreta striolata TaxID=444603 RepID=A0A9N9TQ46_PHYSR|nr:unnamed protein product [Phyllotreta striolata]
MMGNCCTRKKKLNRKIVLLLVGLDNAGKTRAANGLLGETTTTPVPTVGFSVLNLKYLNHSVKIFDLGGGPNIRGIWNTYFVDAHGLIFVIDSSDSSRFDEVKAVFKEILYSDKISGKPILILANKQDDANAADEMELIEYLDIEHLVNARRCPTLVQSCSASEQTQSKLDLGIQKGYNWIMGYIIKNYETLNARVERDVEEQQIKDHEELLEKIKRIKEQHAVEERKQKDDKIETYSEYVKNMNGGNYAKAEGFSQEEIAQAPFEDSSSIGSSTLSKSTESFPPVYITSNEFAIVDRPKSAVELVKNQLKLRENVQKPPARHRANKTAPIHLYGARFPYSADERRRRQENYVRRHLRSADNALFTISKPVMGPSGDCIEMAVFENGKMTERNGKVDVLSIIDI